jgi:hypothetical protein
LAGLGEGEARRFELEVHHVHGALVADAHVGRFRGGGAEVGFEHEAGFPVVGAGIGHGPGVAGIDDFDSRVGFLDFADEARFASLDERREPDDSEDLGSGGGAVDSPHQPFLPPHRNAGARSDLRHWLGHERLVGGRAGDVKEEGPGMEGRRCFREESPPVCPPAIPFSTG